MAGARRSRVGLPHRRRTGTARAAALEPWITTHVGFPVGAIIDALATVTGQPVRVVHRVNEFTVAIELVRAGAGLALIPRWTIPAPDGVVLRPLTDIRSTRRIDALARPENITRATVRAVLATLRQTAQRLAHGGTERGFTFQRSAFNKTQDDSARSSDARCASGRRATGTDEHTRVPQQVRHRRRRSYQKRPIGHVLRR